MAEQQKGLRGIVPPPEIDLKQAIQRAMQFLMEMKSCLPDRLSFEEVEKSPDGTYWLITIGIADQSAPAASQLSALLGARPAPTEFKVFKIATLTGEILSMKMRPVE